MTARFYFLLRALLMVGVLTISSASFAATITFCPRWQYSFLDQGRGEDGLLHGTNPSTKGYQPAAYTFGRIDLTVGSTTTNLMAGYLNSSGCFAPLTQQVGQYTIYLATYVQRPDGATFDVRSTETSPTEWPWAGYYIGAVSATNITKAVDIGNTPGFPSHNTMAVAVQFALESEIGLGPSTSIKIIADSDLPTKTDPTAPYTVHIGHALDGSKHASWKFSTAHEIGHAIQFSLFGAVDHSYGNNSGVAECRCDHIDDPAERPHCLQSREQGGAAQQEGWAQFIALDAMNNDTQSDGIFVYYKDVLLPGDITLPAPVTVYGRDIFQWMKTNCPTGTAYRGTELDWMGFYFAVHSTSTNKYGFAELKNTYLTACTGGTCYNKNPTWPELKAATDTLYGLNTPKANHWRDRGADYGVNQ